MDAFVFMKLCPFLTGLNTSLDDTSPSEGYALRITEHSPGHGFARIFSFRDVPVVSRSLQSVMRMRTKDTINRKKYIENMSSLDIWSTWVITRSMFFDSIQNHRKVVL